MSGLEGGIHEVRSMCFCRDRRHERSVIHRYPDAEAVA